MGGHRFVERIKVSTALEQRLQGESDIVGEHWVLGISVADDCHGSHTSQ